MVLTKGEKLWAGLLAILLLHHDHVAEIIGSVVVNGTGLPVMGIMVLVSRKAGSRNDFSFRTLSLHTSNLRRGRCLCNIRFGIIIQ